MKKTFITHNESNIDVCGTHLVGEIKCKYSKLKKVFGLPYDGDGYKTDAEWNLQFEDGSVATIYNYKDGKNYCGKSGLAKSKITDWHIGGKDSNVVTKIQEILSDF